MRALSMVIFPLLFSIAWADDKERLPGNWNLVSFFTEAVQAEQQNNVYGEHPKGLSGFIPAGLFLYVFP